MKRTLLRLLSCLGLLAAGLLVAGCQQYTCEGACSQYYSEDGCGRPSVLSDGTTSADADKNCAHDCTEALYTTTGSTGGSDDRNYRVLNNQDDALSFIDCVIEQDYSDTAFNATCEDLQHACAWFRW